MQRGQDLGVARAQFTAACRPYLLLFGKGTVASDGPVSATDPGKRHVSISQHFDLQLVYHIYNICKKSAAFCFRHNALSRISQSTGSGPKESHKAGFMQRSWVWNNSVMSHVKSGPKNRPSGCSSQGAEVGSDGFQAAIEDASLHLAPLVRQCRRRNLRTGAASLVHQCIWG